LLVIPVTVYPTVLPFGTFVVVNVNVTVCPSFTEVGFAATLKVGTAGVVEVSLIVKVSLATIVPEVLPVRI